MRKFFILFVALFATSALWAQKFEAGDGLRYAVTSESTVEVVGYNWYDNVLEIPSEVNGPAFPNEALPDLPNPGAGKVTICVQVPQPLCEGMGIAIPGTITTWSEGPAGANGQWINKVDGTDTWYAGTFDWKGDELSDNPRFKIVPANADGSWYYNRHELCGNSTVIVRCERKKSLLSIYSESIWIRILLVCFVMLLAHALPERRINLREECIGIFPRMVNVSDIKFIYQR